MGKLVWTDEIREAKAIEIFDLIRTEGLSLRSVLKRNGMPSSSLFHEWLNKYTDIAEQYARAREERADLIFDEILEIADESSADYAGVNEDGKVIIDGENIQRSRLKIDARKWALSKMQPKKYGDKSTLELEGSEDKPINIISLGVGLKPKK